MSGRRAASAALAGVLLAACAAVLPLGGCSDTSPEREDLASPARTEASPAEREELREPREERREERGEEAEAPYAP